MANIVVRALRALGVGRASVEPDEVLALPEYARGFEVTKQEGGGSLVAQIIEQTTAPSRGDAELVAAYKRHPWLRAVLERIAFAVAGAQPMVYRRRGNERRLLEQHPLYDLWYRPNPILTGLSVWRLLETYVDLKGDGFGIMERSGSGRIVEVWPIPPTWVKETPTTRKPYFEVEHGSYRQIVDEADMLWLRQCDPANPYGRGSGIAQALADELDTDEFAAKHIKDWFYNKAIPALMIALKGASKDQALLAQKKFDDMHRGRGRGSRTHFHGGDMDVKQLNPSFRDMQLVELRQFERDAIVQVFGVPPEILGIIENSNRATIDGADEIFSRWVVTPRLDFIASELNMRIVPSFGSDLELEFDSVVPNDRSYELEVMKAAPWAFRANEFRARAGEDDVDANENRYGIPRNIQDLVEQLSDDLTPRTGGAASVDGGERAFTKTINPAELEMVVDALDTIVLEALYEPEVRQLVLDFGQDAIDSAGLAGSFNVLSPIVIDHIENAAGDLIEGINVTTRNAIRSALQEGVLAGEGPRQLANRISDVMRDATRRRAITIARTEVARSANFARWQGMAQSGVVFRRRWVTARDARVRDPHRFLHGKTAGINEPFSLSDGGRSVTAMHPGGFGVASLDINCRCVTVPVVDLGDEGKRFTDEDATQEELDDEAERLASKFDRWEERVRRAFARGFRQQEGDLLDVLERLTAGRAP